MIRGGVPCTDVFVVNLHAQPACAAPLQECEEVIVCLCEGFSGSVGTQVCVCANLCVHVRVFECMCVPAPEENAYRTHKEPHPIAESKNYKKMLQKASQEGNLSGHRTTQL